MLEYFSKKKITPFIFESISGSFYEGAAAQVRLNGKYGVIDVKGKMLIPCIYEEMSVVNIDGQEYYIVSKNNRFGVINDQHEVVVPFEYEGITRSYNSNILLVVSKNGKSGVMNFISRKMVIPMQFDRIELLGSSSNMIKVKKGADYTLYNTSGEQVLSNWYQRLDINDDQTALVEQKGKKGLINLAEKKVVPFEYDALERVYGSSPNLFVAQKAGKYGVVSADGKLVLPVQFDHITSPRSDLFIVAKGGKKGLMGFDGRQVVAMEYEEVVYGERYFLVKKNGKAGIISRDGDVVVPVEYDMLNNVSIGNEYSSTVFTGTRQGRKGMIDAVTGKPKIEFVYDDIIGTRRNSYNSTEYFNNTIIAVKNGKYGMIEQNGTVVVPFEYEDLQYLNSFAVIAKKGGKYGIRDIYSGVSVLAFEYGFVSNKNNVIIAYKDGYEKYRLSGGKVTKIE
jgi:hypothetical protein